MLTQSELNKDFLCFSVLRVGRPGFESGRGNIFSFSIASRSDLEPTQTPIKWVAGETYQGIKRLGVKLTIYIPLL
jgi:hypothetical protein